MRQDKLSKQNVILYLCGIIPVVWLGLLVAPCLKDGLPGLVRQFGSVMQNPFQIQLCEDSVKTVLTLLLVYGIAIGVYLSTEHNSSIYRSALSVAFFVFTDITNTYSQPEVQGPRIQIR